MDNRKLIVAFALLIALCGCFFVLGFIEGKRQNAQGVSRSAPPVNPGGERQTKLPAAAASKKPSEERSVKEELDWYKSVGDGGEADSKTSPKPATASQNNTVVKQPEKKAAVVSAPSPPAVKSAEASAKPSYSVQIGAFRDRKKAEDAGVALKSKGYSFYIEASDSGVYFVKVGKFDARPEAVDMMHRLKKDGFPTIIKAD